MSRKIEIELTSARGDGTWTWRVAGARQPKGVLDGSLLPEGAKVGDVLRAEADFELEGTSITAVAPLAQKRPEPERLQLLGDTRPFEGVTTSLVPKSGRPRHDRDDRERRDRRPERPPGERAGAPAGGRPGGARVDRPGGPRGNRATARREHPGAPRGDHQARPPSERTGSGERRPAPTRDRPAEAGAGGHRDRGPSAPPRPRRLNPGNAHRSAVLDGLPPEQRAIAEQLLQGGIPAVRRALQEQNAKAREEGRPEVQPDALLVLAEELLPSLKAAEWRDRADAALKDVEELNLRDLRSIVAGADAGARDDESRILAKSLREALDQREAAQRDAWIAEITGGLDEGKVTRALRVAGRPPDPRTRFPGELMTRLAEAASSAMNPEASVERWTALLAAVLESPVRRSVKPVGLPKAPGEALLAAARQASGRIPALAAILGLDMPPPPGPPRPGVKPGRRPGGGPQPGAGPRPGGGPQPGAGPRPNGPAGTGVGHGAPRPPAAAVIAEEAHGAPTEPPAEAPAEPAAIEPAAPTAIEPTLPMATDPNLPTATEPTLPTATEPAELPQSAEAIAGEAPAQPAGPAEGTAGEAPAGPAERAQTEEASGADRQTAPETPDSDG